jgi:hypothetical protein
VIGAGVDAAAATGIGPGPGTVGFLVYWTSNLEILDLNDMALCRATSEQWPTSQQGRMTSDQKPTANSQRVFGGESDQWR